MVELLPRTFVVERDGEVHLNFPGLRSGQEIEVTVRVADTPVARSSELFLESVRRMHDKQPDLARSSAEIDTFFRSERDSWDH